MNCKYISEVFKNEHGAVYQCNVNNCYWLDFKGEQTSFKVNDFLRFKESIDQLDVEAMLVSADRSADFTLLMPFRSNRCFLLTALEVVNLRELLSAARFMIELNSVLSVCLKARPSRVLA